MRKHLPTTSQPRANHEPGQPGVNLSRLLAAIVSGMTLLAAAQLQMAHAAHPLISEDPDTQGKGGQQIELALDRRHENADRENPASLAYSFGVSDTLDAILSIPVTIGSTHGLGDMGAALKWRFLETEGATLAIKPEVFLPTGNETRHQGNGRAGAMVTVVASHSVQSWRLLANLGIRYNRYKLAADEAAMRKILWRASASVSYALNDALRFVTDTGLERAMDRSDNKHPAFGLVGLIYSPYKHLDLDAGLRVNFRCTECHAWSNRQVGVGLTSRF
jgi:hypothetical protein